MYLLLWKNGFVKLRNVFARSWEWFWSVGWWNSTAPLIHSHLSLKWGLLLTYPISPLLFEGQLSCSSQSMNTMYVLYLYLILCWILYWFFVGFCIGFCIGLYLYKLSSFIWRSSHKWAHVHNILSPQSTWCCFQSAFEKKLCASLFLTQMHQR